MRARLSGTRDTRMSEEEIEREGNHKKEGDLREERQEEMGSTSNKRKDMLV